MDLNGAEGVMRSLKTEGSEAAAEDRFCFPPATPTCVSTVPCILDIGTWGSI